ncbi:MAG: hypothetical protein AB1715_08485, partial [Acidobacteriota bacterium]
MTLKNGGGIKPYLVFFSLALLFSLPPWTAAREGVGEDQAESVVSNPSFEEGEDSLPRGWKTRIWQPEAFFALDSSVAHSGKSSVKISSVAGADACFTTVVQVKPYSRYRLSGWIKTENLEPGTSRGALINFHGTDIRSKPLSGTQDWTRVEVVFESGANDAFALNCLFGGWGKAKGTAWFDDIGLDLLSTRTLKPAVTVDAARTLAPISKYIYGQFIEHLGRCIYQGIWAEMLEDRKFFYPVGGPDSPWETFGEPHGVWMNPTAAYAGGHSPEIRLKGTGHAGGI